jgi:hypothetical protein
MPGEDVSLELYSANGRADLMAEALGGPVEVVERAADRQVAAQA